MRESDGLNPTHHSEGVSQSPDRKSAADSENANQAGDQLSFEAILEAGARHVFDQDFPAGRWEYQLFSSRTEPVDLDLLIFDSHCFRWVRLNEHYPSPVRSGVRGCLQSGAFIVHAGGQLKLVFSSPTSDSANAYKLIVRPVND